MAKQRMQVGLSLGPSFAELCAIDQNKKPLFQARSYLPKEPLRELFKKLAVQAPNHELMGIQVCLRALEKIFPTRLGGSVAQVVTSGFETWPWLRQPLSETHFSMFASRSEALASQELIFGISERVDAQGHLRKSVDLESLQFISAKLKLMEVQKICVNLLFSHLNPTNENQVRSFFQEEGFEVFCRPRLEVSTDEVTAWRTNILNACLSGTFLELEKEMRDAVELSFPDQPTWSLRYVNSLGELEKNPLQNISGILFGWSGLLPQGKHILHLGLEKWSWIRPRVIHRWKSPWGSVEIPHRESLPLSVQGSCLLEKDFFENISWGAEQGFEPGPMSFGRAQKPLLVDVFLDQIPEAKAGFGSLVSPQGEARFKESLHLLQKNSGLDSLQSDLFVRSLQTSLLHCTDLKADEKIELSGFWAEFLLKPYQKTFPHLKFQLLDSATEAMSAAQLT